VGDPADALHVGGDEDPHRILSGSGGGQEDEQGECAGFHGATFTIRRLPDQ
jgi:hypothetical protein